MVVRIVEGDALAVLPSLESESVQMIGPTSPPYLNLRSYLPAGHPDKDKEIGSEPTPEAFIETLVTVFRECHRILRNDGIFVLNLGDSMSGSGKGPSKSMNGPTGGANPHSMGIRSGETYGLPPKNLLMIPFRVAMALQADGWHLRSVLPWLKRNGMPESAADRPTTSVEYLFLFSKRGRYYWDAEAIKQPAASFGRQHTAGVQPSKVRAYAAGTGQPRHGGDLSVNYERATRNFRNSDLFFKTWQGLLLDEDGDPLALIVNPKPNPLAHFASFPDTLVDPFMRAGASGRGCCPACRAPWVRVVERGNLVLTTNRRTTPTTRGDASRDPSARTDTQPVNGAYYERSTTGWRPGCSCSPVQEPRPCVVLDPFLGSGTTALVADQLGRDAIGIELSPVYAEMARKKIAEDAPMFSTVTIEHAERQVPLLLEAT